MGKIVRIQKVTQADAIKPTTPEEEGMLREWFAEHFTAMGLEADEAFERAATMTFTDAKQMHLWFARDIGSKVVYIIPAASFITDFEEVDEEDIPALEQDLKFLEDFKFTEGDSR